MSPLLPSAGLPSSYRKKVTPTHPKFRSCSQTIEVLLYGQTSGRADIVPLEDKQVIEERLSMYDDLIERDPKMQRIRAESRAQGRAEGRAEGEVKGEMK